MQGLGGAWSDPVYGPQGRYVRELREGVEPNPGSTKDDNPMSAVEFYCCASGYD